MDIVVWFVLGLLVGLPTGALFFSDKIVRALGLVTDEDNSWLFPNKEDSDGSR